MAALRLSDLFGAFFRVELMAFGMAILQALKTTARRRGLASEAELEEGLALVQLYPGPIMVDLVAAIGFGQITPRPVLNSAAFVGMLGWVCVSLGAHLGPRPAAYVLVVATVVAVRVLKWESLKVFAVGLALWSVALQVGLA